MDKDGFVKYLKKGGRSEKAVMRCIKYVSNYENFLQSMEHTAEIEEAGTAPLNQFIRELDAKPQSNSKAHLWAIRYYYNYMDNPEMSRIAGILREERIERKPFPLKDFLGVDIRLVEVLLAQGIRNINHMLRYGATQNDRTALSIQTGIPEAQILELVKLSDLARIPGVKGVRARLYYDAGIDTVEKIASLEPEELREKVVAYVNKSGFDGLATLPAEAEYTVEKARVLPKIIDF